MKKRFKTKKMKERKRKIQKTYKEHSFSVIYKSDNHVYIYIPAKVGFTRKTLT